MLSMGDNFISSPNHYICTLDMLYVIFKVPFRSKMLYFTPNLFKYCFQNYKYMQNLIKGNNYKTSLIFFC